MLLHHPCLAITKSFPPSELCCTQLYFESKERIYGVFIGSLCENISRQYLIIQEGKSTTLHKCLQDFQEENTVTSFFCSSECCSSDALIHIVILFFLHSDLHY